MQASAAVRLTRRELRKSSYSANVSDCVELPGTLNAVRDSKNGDVLSVTARAVNSLLTVVKSQDNR